MPLPKFKTQEEIPEAFRDEYEEKDGEWVPKADPELSKVTSTLEKVREEKKAEAEARKKAEAEAKKKEDELKAAKLAAEAQTAGIDDEQLAEIKRKAKADADAEKAAELEELRKKADLVPKLEEKNLGLTLHQKVKEEMAAAGVLAERIDDLMKLTMEEYQLTDSGTPMLVNHPTMALKQFFEGDIKKKHPGWFKGSQAEGGGAGGHHQSGLEMAGTTAEDVLNNPAGAMSAAREQK